MELLTVSQFEKVLTDLVMERLEKDTAYYQLFLDPLAVYPLINYKVVKNKKKQAEKVIEEILRLKANIDEKIKTNQLLPRIGIILLGTEVDLRRIKNKETEMGLEVKFTDFGLGETNPHSTNLLVTEPGDMELKESQIARILPALKRFNGIHLCRTGQADVTVKTSEVHPAEMKSAKKSKKKNKKSKGSKAKQAQKKKAQKEMTDINVLVTDPTDDKEVAQETEKVSQILKAEQSKVSKLASSALNEPVRCETAIIQPRIAKKNEVMSEHPKKMGLEDKKSEIEVLQHMERPRTSTEDLGPDRSLPHELVMKEETVYYRVCNKRGLAMIILAKNVKDEKKQVGLVLMEIMKLFRETSDEYNERMKNKADRPMCMVCGPEDQLDLIALVGKNNMECIRKFDCTSSRVYENGGRLCKFMILAKVDWDVSLFELREMVTEVQKPRSDLRLVAPRAEIIRPSASINMEKENIHFSSLRISNINMDSSMFCTKYHPLSLANLQGSHQKSPIPPLFLGERRNIFDLRVITQPSHPTVSLNRKKTYGDTSPKPLALEYLPEPLVKTVHVQTMYTKEFGPLDKYLEKTHSIGTSTDSFN